MVKWFVRLKGNKFDLQELPKHLSSEDISVIEEEGEYYLTSKEFSLFVAVEDVLNRAKQIVEFINGSAYLYFGNYYPIDVDSVCRVTDDGKKQHFVFLSDTFNIRSEISASVGITNDDGTVKQFKESKIIEHVLKLAEQHKDVADALRFFRKNDWINLYKVYEIIRDDVGGEQNIIKRGWTTKAEIRRFTGTAQSKDALGDDARHASKKYKPPRIAMSLGEARTLVKVILQKWLESK